MYNTHAYHDQSCFRSAYWYETKLLRDYTTHPQSHEALLLKAGGYSDSVCMVLAARALLADKLRGISFGQLQFRTKTKTPQFLANSDNARTTKASTLMAVDLS